MLLSVASAGFVFWMGYIPVFTTTERDRTPGTTGQNQ
jgi:hypothetical protein